MTSTASSLHAIAILPGLPKHLAKPFMLLAVTAKHRTGLARPGKTVITKNWGIPYSSWHRNVQELEELGLVRQVVFGYDKTGQAAEYELLHVEPDPTGGTPTEPREGSSSSTSTRNPPLSGRGPTPRNRATSAALTDHETQEWLRIRQRLLAGLTPGDRDRIEAEAQEFDQLPQLQRTAVRLACLGKEELLVDELARSPRAGRPAYEGGARAVLPAMWSRLATVARAYGVDIGDRTVAEPQTVCDLGTAFPMLRGWMDAMAEHTEATAAHTS